MKKLPLALSALAISTVSVAGIASPTFAETRAEYNTGNWEDLPLKITRINVRDNSITMMAKDLASGVSLTYFAINGLDAERAQEIEMDNYMLVGKYVGYPENKYISDYLQRQGAKAGKEFTLTSDKLYKPLAENTSKVLYYIGRAGAYGQQSGKIDYSLCVDSSAYRTALEIAGNEDVVDCRVEANENGEGYHYQPYYNDARLTIPTDEMENLEAAALARMKAADARDVMAEGGETGNGGVESSGETGDVVVKVDTGADKGEEVTVVQNTETGVEQANSGVEGEPNYVTYATVTSGEGSAYQNPEIISGNTEVEGDYAADTEAWVVDESKVWEDDLDEVETPELGEEDCGHFWPLVMGWTLAVAGWGIMGARWLVKRK